MVASYFAYGAGKYDKEVVFGVRVGGNGGFDGVIFGGLGAVFSVENMVKLGF